MSPMKNTFTIFIYISLLKQYTCTRNLKITYNYNEIQNINL